MFAEQWMNGQSPRTGLPWSSQAFILNLENARKIGPSVSVLYQGSKKLQNLTIANSIMCDNLAVTQDAFVYNTLCVCVREWICQSWIWLHVKSCVPAAAAKSLQSCLTLCNPIDGSPPGSPVPGILQARTLEWVAISFSNAWKWKMKVKLLSCVWLLATPWAIAYQAPPSMGFSRQEYWSACVPKSVQIWVCVRMIVHAGVCVFVYVYVSKWTDLCRSVWMCTWVHMYMHVLRWAGALHTAVWLWPHIMSPPQILLFLVSKCIWELPYLIHSFIHSELRQSKVV